MSWSVDKLKYFLSKLLTAHLAQPTQSCAEGSELLIPAGSPMLELPTSRAVSALNTGACGWPSRRGPSSTTSEPSPTPYLHSASCLGCIASCWSSLCLRCGWCSVSSSYAAFHQASSTSWYVYLFVENFRPCPTSMLLQALMLDHTKQVKGDVVWCDEAT